ncbi:YceI family protein [Spirosoma sp.]|uniref:YceI family protein n=1 Tax=Spirosoma sp. TaxID=1899569 RepID=UPI003B3B5CC8
MKSIVFAVAALLAGSITYGQSTWALDKAHSKVGFTVTHMLLSEVDGHFKAFDAKITSSKPDLSDAVFEFTGDVNSIDTGNEKRDSDLKSDKFFDAANYPTLTFKSTSFKKEADKKYKVTGDLTMHGVTKPVTLDVVMNGPITNESPRGKQEKVGFKMTSTLKRSDFKVGTIPVAVVSEEVEIKANGEFTKQASATADAKK